MSVDVDVNSKAYPLADCKLTKNTLDRLCQTQKYGNFDDKVNFLSLFSSFQMMSNQLMIPMKQQTIFNHNF